MEVEVSSIFVHRSQFCEESWLEVESFLYVFSSLIRIVVLFEKIAKVKLQMFVYIFKNSRRMNFFQLLRNVFLLLFFLFFFFFFNACCNTTLPRGLSPHREYTNIIESKRVSRVKACPAYSSVCLFIHLGTILGRSNASPQLRKSAAKCALIRLLLVRTLRCGRPFVLQCARYICCCR